VRSRKPEHANRARGATRFFTTCELAVTPARDRRVLSAACLLQPRRAMHRLAISIALIAATGCIDVCDSSCQQKYDDCLDTGRSEDECAEMLANCEASCSESPAWAGP
jgi:hypothetical protein